MKILMCRPDHFAIEYEINPWMDVTNQVDKKRALSQWESLYETYQTLGVEVELIEQVKGLPDMVFTANAGTVIGKTFVSGNFRFKERKGEEVYFQKWFKSHDYEVVTLSDFQGGEGDALFYLGTLFMGYGFRSTTKAHQEMQRILNVPVVSLHLIDPYFYDFDTAFCPVGDKGILYYPEAFDEESRARVAAVKNALPMTKVQAEHFIGNSVLVGDTLLVGYEDEDLREKAKKLGVNLQVLDMSEFKKSGGGIKCLTLYLQRD